ncbi:hypothetical protein [Dyadobacter bucti]|uniref:hypothetical protein n=1 Tax=Dyadobacter bucti TaxID=2572203 RepID=UPI001107FB2F|nr:hypothetical protein [Dyadobacter bucti]
MNTNYKRLIKMKKYFMLFSSILLLKCWGISDYSEDLGNGFSYESSGQEFKNIRTPIHGQKDIYGKVTEYKFNADFILAIQQPSREVYQGSIAYELRNADRVKYKNNSTNDRIESERVADSLILNDHYYKRVFAHPTNYWIISHHSKTMFGPLTKGEYFQKRKELKVPDKLKLDEEKL